MRAIHVNGWLGGATAVTLVRVRVGEVEKRSVKCTGLALRDSPVTTTSKVKSEVQDPTQLVPDVLITKMHSKYNIHPRNVV